MSAAQFFRRTCFCWARTELSEQSSDATFRWIARMIVSSVARSKARCIVRSPERFTDRVHGGAVLGSLDRSLERSFARSVACVIARSTEPALAAGSWRRASRGRGPRPGVPSRPAPAQPCTSFNVLILLAQAHSAQSKQAHDRNPK